MDNQSLIIHLIVQDMRHRQFVWQAGKLGMDAEDHYLDVLTAVGILMGIPKQELSDRWVDVYVSFLNDATGREITGRGENLGSLAEKCYHLLVACREIECRTGEG